MDSPNRAMANISGGAELQGKLRHGEGKDDQDHSADQAADDRINGVHIQGFLHLALSDHVVAVEGLSDGGGGAGRVDKDGGDAAGPNGGVIDAQQHSHALRGFQPEGEGSQNGDAHGGGQAGQSTDDHTGHYAQDAIEKDIRGKDGDKSIADQ